MATQTAIEGFQVGDRVELHPATDAWMRGDRYGDIVKLGRGTLHVHMDKSGHTLRARPELLILIEHRCTCPSVGNYSRESLAERFRCERCGFHVA